MWKDGRQSTHSRVAGGVAGSKSRQGSPALGSSSQASKTACRIPSFTTHPRPGTTQATTAIQRLLRPWEKVRVTMCAGSGGWGGGLGQQDLHGWQMNATSCRVTICVRLGGWGGGFGQQDLRGWQMNATSCRVMICVGLGGWGGRFGRRDLRGWQMNAASCPLLRLRIGLAWQLAGSLRQCLQLHLHMHLRLCLDFQRPHLLPHLHLHPHPLQHPHPLPLPLPRSSNRRTR